MADGDFSDVFTPELRKRLIDQRNKLGRPELPKAEDVTSVVVSAHLIHEDLEAIVQADAGRRGLTRSPLLLGTLLAQADADLMVEVTDPITKKKHKVSLRDLADESPEAGVHFSFKYEYLRHPPLTPKGSDDLTVSPTDPDTSSGL